MELCRLNYIDTVWSCYGIHSTSICPYIYYDFKKITNLNRNNKKSCSKFSVNWQTIMFHLALLVCWSLFVLWTKTSLNVLKITIKVSFGFLHFSLLKSGNLPIGKNKINAQYRMLTNDVIRVHWCSQWPNYRRDLFDARKVALSNETK